MNGNISPRPVGISSQVVSFQQPIQSFGKKPTKALDIDPFRNFTSITNKLSLHFGHEERKGTGVSLPQLEPLWEQALSSSMCFLVSCQNISHKNKAFSFSLECSLLTDTIRRYLSFDLPNMISSVYCQTRGMFSLRLK